MRYGIILFLIIVLFFGSIGYCGELDAWEFNIMGINPVDFEGRKWYVAAGGVIASLVIHEAGHLASAELMGADPYFNWSERAAYAGDSYQDWSNDKKALFSAAGFIAQTVTGAILTAIPKTRYSDFTLGFNAFSSINGFYYAATDGADYETSDTENLDRYGYNGTAIALTNGVINGAFTYISLNKDK